MSWNLRDKKIVLYGYNDQFDRTERITNNLTACGLHVDFIIDKNADKFKREILKYNEFLNIVSNEDKKDFSFILNFWDANQHTIVAKQLHSDGFDNILFLPFENDFLIKKAYILRNAYNYVLYGKIDKHLELPCFSELIDSKNDNLLINDYGEYISFWVDVTKLYIMRLPVEKDIDKEYKVSVFSDVPILDYKYYRELIEYIYKGKGYPKGYIINSLNGRNEKEFLENRRELFRILDYKLKYDNSFFVDSPILVKKRNETTYTVLDGLHRAFFLWKKGYERVPVICKKEMVLDNGKVEYRIYK